MQGLVKKWSNSAAPRIPPSELEAAQPCLDQPIDVREEAGRIMIEPIHSTADDINHLVAAITDDNRHDPIDTSKPVGKEIW